MKYKLVEISYEEHVALYEAGAWTPWGFKPSTGDRWYTPLTDMMFAPAGLAPSDVFSDEYDQKYYTRVEDSDEH